MHLFSHIRMYLFVNLGYGFFGLFRLVHRDSTAVSYKF